VDVFTDRPFAGNQLTVVHGGTDLITEQCLALPRELNYSETVFPVVGDRASQFLRTLTPGPVIVGFHDDGVLELSAAPRATRWVPSTTSSPPLARGRQAVDLRRRRSGLAVGARV
jgi:hypothetical protein